MASGLHVLAVGGPDLVSGEGWDVAPLVIWMAILALMRWARIPLHVLPVVSAFAAALILDLAADAYGVPLLITLSLLLLAFGIVAHKRMPAR